MVAEEPPRAEVSEEYAGIEDALEVEKGKWYIPHENGEKKYAPFKVEKTSETWDSTPLGTHFNALKVEGVTINGLETVYQVRKRGGAKKFGDEGPPRLALAPYHGMNMWEEVSQEDELLDADEILGDDEEVVLPAETVRKTLHGETDTGEEIKTDAQPTRKEANKYVAFHVSPLFRSRFR
ncbi:MAG: hypothetical protein ABEJ98_05795 [Candidatus Nanohaloarchaea archaeon]